MRTKRREKYINYSTEHMERVIYQWVKGKLNRDIWRLWLIDGLTYEQTAEELEISDKTVARCIRDYDERVFLHL